MDQTPQNPELKIKVDLAPGQRNFAIPGCSVVIQSDDAIPVEELLAIAFQLAGSNPGAKVNFWIEVKG